MDVYRRVGQTKFEKDGLAGLLTLHDNGRIAVSMDHKELFSGLKYEETDSYYYISKPSTNEQKIIMDRLFDFKT